MVGELLFLDLTADTLLRNQAHAVQMHFNRVSSWASSWILAQSDRASQLKVMSFLAQLAAIVFNRRDFLSSMAIAAGMVCHDVARLRLCVDLPEVLHGTIAQLEEMLSGANNYASLRSAERACSDASASSVPYLPLHNRDFITVAETSGGRMTFDQLYRIGLVSADLLLLQRFVKVPSEAVAQSAAVQRILHLPFCSDQSRAQLSDNHRNVLVASNALPSPKETTPKKSLLGGKKLRPSDSKAVRKVVEVSAAGGSKSRSSTSDASKGLVLLNQPSSLVMSSEQMPDIASPSHDEDSVSALEENLKTPKSLDDASLEESDADDISESAESDSEFWQKAQERWERRFGLRLTDATIRGGMAAASESSKPRRKAHSHLTDLAKYFYRHGRPMM